MKKTVYRVFSLNPTAWMDVRNGQYKDFDTLTEAIEYRNAAKNYRNSDIDVIEKTFNPDTFEYAETKTDRINVE